MRGSVMVHNPFVFAKGRNETRVHVEAKFEKRARILNRIDSVDGLIARAVKERKSYLVESLSRARERLISELDSIG